MSQPRFWRLPVCVKYSEIQIELDSVSDGCWGALGSGAALVNLLQRYKWDAEDGVHIYPYSGTCGLNPLLTPYHQLDSEFMGLSLTQKEVQKALQHLRLFLGSKLPRPR